MKDSLALLRTALKQYRKQEYERGFVNCGKEEYHRGFEAAKEATENHPLLVINPDGKFNLEATLNEIRAQAIQATRREDIAAVEKVSTVRYDESYDDDWFSFTGSSVKDRILAALKPLNEETKA